MAIIERETEVMVPVTVTPTAAVPPVPEPVVNVRAPVAADKS